MKLGSGHESYGLLLLSVKVSQYGAPTLGTGFLLQGQMVGGLNGACYEW